MLAIDLGTTNWKVALYSIHGKLVDILRTPTITHCDESGNSYYDATEIWGRTSELCRNMLQKHAVSIAAVSVTSVAESIVGIKANGEVIAEVLAWFDVRAAKQIYEIESLISADEIYSITGLDMNPIFSLPKIMWIRENRPKDYEKAVKWLQIADYINYKLTGEFVTDYTLASRTLAYDIRRKDWSRTILDKVGVPISVMPQIIESGTRIGAVRNIASVQTGIPAGTPVVVGGNDHPCASLATSVVTENSILDSSGTAESFLYITKPGHQIRIEFKGQRTCSFLQRDRYALWGGIISSGRSFDWAMTTFEAKDLQNGTSREAILERVAKAKGMSSGLIFYPHIRGSGAPYWNPNASGAFVGIRDLFNGDNFMRSVIESLCMQARIIVEMEQEVAGCEAKKICVVGGSSNNLLWQRIKADILQKELELSNNPEATSFGVAMLGAIGIGEYSGIEEVSRIMCKDNVMVYPDENMAEYYEELYDQYCRAYRHIQEVDAIIREGRE